MRLAISSDSSCSSMFMLKALAKADSSMLMACAMLDESFDV